MSLTAVPYDVRPFDAANAPKPKHDRKIDRRATGSSAQARGHIGRAMSAKIDAENPAAYLRISFLAFGKLLEATASPTA
jgi:hypothetical protein